MPPKNRGKILPKRMASGGFTLRNHGMPNLTIRSGGLTIDLLPVSTIDRTLGFDNPRGPEIPRKPVKPVSSGHGGRRL